MRRYYRVETNGLKSQMFKSDALLYTVSIFIEIVECSHSFRFRVSEFDTITFVTLEMDSKLFKFYRYYEDILNSLDNGVSYMDQKSFEDILLKLSVEKVD